MADDLICSSKGCTAAAQHRVEWNNPKIHTPDRRKTWLACDEHEPTLRGFLAARGFHRETLPLDALRPVGRQAGVDAGARRCLVACS